MTDPDSFSPWVGWVAGGGVLLLLGGLCLLWATPHPTCPACGHRLTKEMVCWGSRVWFCDHVLDAFHVCGTITPLEDA